METSTYIRGLARSNWPAGQEGNPLWVTPGPVSVVPLSKFSMKFFFSVLWWLDRQPMHERTGREREETGGRRSGRRANERACKYICMYKKKKKKENSLPWSVLPDVGRGTYPWTGGSEFLRFGKKREGEIGERARREWKKRNEPCGAWKGSCERIFFSLQKGASCGATVERRIDRGGVDLKGGERGRTCAS